MLLNKLEHSDNASSMLEVEETIQLADDGNEGMKMQKVDTSASIDPIPDTVYSSKIEVWIFIICTALGQMLSTISIPIYFPALTVLADYFNTSLDMINLTATMYSIFQGISPLFWATLSDAIGRRPVYIMCILCYVGANVGLALGRSYWVLFGLRCLQAFGGASTVPLTGAVIGDITTRKNRGGIMGVATGLGLLGNCFGPLIGGGLMSQWNWQGIFWFLMGLGIFVLIVIFLLYPETHRGLAGNGSIMPKPLINRSPYAYVRHWITGVPYLPHQPEYEMEWRSPKTKVNLFQWLTLLIQTDVILVLVPMSLHYTTWYMILTIQSTRLASDYKLSTTQVGYTYLSSGVGTFLGSLVAGRLLQWSFQRHVNRRKKVCEESNILYRQSDVNIYFARLDLCFWASLLLIVTTIVFGWTLQYKVSFYCPVVMTFFISASSTFFMSASTTMLVDIYPNNSGAAVACSNLCRCLLCAAGLAAVDSMSEAMGPGGMATLMAGFCGLSLSCLLFLLRYGEQIAKKRKDKESARRHAKAQQA